MSRLYRELESSYIKDLSKFGELTDWSVAIISSKTGDPLRVNDLTVGMVDRSIVKDSHSERDPEASYLRALSPPEDELIDLRDLHSEEINMNIAQFKAQLGSKQITSSYIRQNLRPAERGLLLLYPLNPNSHLNFDQNEDILENSMEHTAPLHACYNLFGVTIVFPKTKLKEKSFNYMTNGSI